MFPPGLYVCRGEIVQGQFVALQNPLVVGQQRVTKLKADWFNLLRAENQREMYIVDKSDIEDLPGQILWHTTFDSVFYFPYLAVIQVHHQMPWIDM